MRFSRMILSLLIVIGGLSNLSSAQERSSPPRQSQGFTRVEPDRWNARARIQTVRSFIDRAAAFQSRTAKVVTLVNLASLLWSHKGQEDYAKQIFLRLFEELKLAGQTESHLKTVEVGPSEPDMTPRLLRILLSFLAKHDSKLAQELLKETTATDPRADRWSISVATDLIRDGDAATALTMLEPTLQSDLSSLDKYDLGALVFFRLNLHMRDAAAADALFLQALAKTASRQRVTADELLVVGNYLFIDDHDFSPNFLVFTSVKVENIYFPEAIVGERSGISRDLARNYLTTALTVLTRQLDIETVPLTRKRYAVCARLLALKAQKFAPELVNAFSAMSQSIAASELMIISASEKAGVNKLIDYGVASAELEKIVGAEERDGRALGLAGTAYMQKDLDTAFKLAGHLSDQDVRRRVHDVIAFRRAANALEQADDETAKELAGKVGQPELRIVLDLGLASLYIKKKKVGPALSRLQAVLTDLRERQPDARALYAMNAAALLIKVEPTLALQTLGEAVKAFDESPKSVSELKSRVHLSRIRSGKKAVVFSISTSAVPFGELNEALVALFRKSPLATAGLVLGLKNERVLGTALIALARVNLESKATLSESARGR